MEYGVKQRGNGKRRSGVPLRQGGATVERTALAYARWDDADPRH